MIIPWVRYKCNNNTTSPPEPALGKMALWKNLYFGVPTPPAPTCPRGHSNLSWVIKSRFLPLPVLMAPLSRERVLLSPCCFLPPWPRDGDGLPGAWAAGRHGWRGTSMGGGPQGLVWTVPVPPCCYGCWWHWQPKINRAGAPSTSPHSVPCLPCPPASALAPLAIAALEPCAHFPAASRDQSWAGRGPGPGQVLHRSAWPIPTLWVRASYGQGPNKLYWCPYPWHHYRDLAGTGTSGFTVAPFLATSPCQAPSEQQLEAGGWGLAEAGRVVPAWPWHPKQLLHLPTCKTSSAVYQ